MSNADNIVRYTYLIILALLLLSFYYSFFVLPSSATLKIEQYDNQLLENYTTCKENATIECKINNCSGLMTCKNNEWGPCIVKMICKPGSKAPCVENGCAVGYKICNECGTGYGKCVLTRPR